LYIVDFLLISSEFGGRSAKLAFVPNLYNQMILHLVRHEITS